METTIMVRYYISIPRLFAGIIICFHKSLFCWFCSFSGSVTFLSYRALARKVWGVVSWQLTISLQVFWHGTDISHLRLLLSWFDCWYMEHLYFHHHAVSSLYVIHLTWYILLCSATFHQHDVICSYRTCYISDVPLYRMIGSHFEIDVVAPLSRTFLTSSDSCVPTLPELYLFRPVLAKTHSLLTFSIWFVSTFYFIF